MNATARGYTFEASKHGNIVGALQGIDGPKRAQIINRQLCHFFPDDTGPGLGMAQGLDMDVSAIADGTVHANKY